MSPLFVSGGHQLLVNRLLGRFIQIWILKLFENLFPFGLSLVPRTKGAFRVAPLPAFGALIWSILSTAWNAFPSKEWLYCFSLGSGTSRSCRREETSTFWGVSFLVHQYPRSSKFEEQVCLPGSCIGVLTTYVPRDCCCHFWQERPKLTLIIFKDQKCVVLLWTHIHFNHPPNERVEFGDLLVSFQLTNGPRISVIYENEYWLTYLRGNQSKHENQRRGPVRNSVFSVCLWVVLFCGTRA